MIIIVKNLSNPLNARKVASLIADDGRLQNLEFAERTISVFFSDNRINNLEMGLKQLKEQKVIPQEYFLSPETKALLIDQDFIDEGYSAPEAYKGQEVYFEEVFENYGSIEFTAQLDSLKAKLMKSWSGGMTIEDHTMDNFERKFTRPMNNFIQQMKEQEIYVGELQAFAVVYATDQLSLGDNIKEEVYDLMFGRFDAIKTVLHYKYKFQYTWPSISGASFIEIGKRYSVTAELADLAKRFKSISGLDTYSDEVLQVFFLELLTGKLTDELAKKKILYRWADETVLIDDYHEFFLPPSDYSIQSKLKVFLFQAVIAHLILTVLESTPPTLEEILNLTFEMDDNQRAIYLARKIEASLTRKTVLLQFGTTLVNFFTNIKTNPAKSITFIEIAQRYYDKSGSLVSFIASYAHSIRTSLKNSGGMIRQYLKDMSNEELDNLIQGIVDESLIEACKNISGEVEFESETKVNYLAVDIKLKSSTVDLLRPFFTTLMHETFVRTAIAFREKEGQKEEPISTTGGLTELVQDFKSTVNYHGSKNPMVTTLVEEMTSNGISKEVALNIANVCNYLTYQISSKEGLNGEKMLKDLVSYYKEKSIRIGNIQLTNGSTFRSQEDYETFIFSDLQQAHVIASLASKTRVEVYNAWNVIDNNHSKNAKYLNEFLIPNILYWQRIPR
ncbi:MAG: hypothetical protein IH840_16025, partial [Candidatus Heimdallarchaeota archaeon]|nr:hypothetical protein [Candidatus Heimdallarchaeota archaeon]